MANYEYVHRTPRPGWELVRPAFGAQTAIAHRCRQLPSVPKLLQN